VADLLDLAVDGDRPALARLLTMVERGGDDARTVSSVVHPRCGAATTVGITGAPGAGKSTLTSALCRAVRGAGDDVAVLAVDPSSPFTGGAILGDRIRMGEHVLDDGVFIRSMATRGHLGGLAVAAPDATRVLDAAGYGWVVVETVGVGQVEVDVAPATDTTVVVVNPGWGDAVQAAKAGLADVFVVNKADLPGAQDLARQLKGASYLRAGSQPEVLTTTATSGQGAAQLLDLLQATHQARRLPQAQERVRRLEKAMQAMVLEELQRRLEVMARADLSLECEAVLSGAKDLHGAVRDLLAKAGQIQRSVAT